MNRLPLHTKIFIGLAVGLILGLLCEIFLPGDARVQWVVDNIASPVGDLFLRFVKMVVVPLVFTAIILGIADLGDVRKIGRIGTKTLLFTLVITGVGVLTGIVLVNLFQPGAGIPESVRADLLTSLTGNKDISKIVTNASEAKSALQSLLLLVPENPLADAAGVFNSSYQGGGLLAVMFFAVVFGVAMALSDPVQVEPLKQVLQGVYAVIMKIIDFAMNLAPFGVAGLIFKTATLLGFATIGLLLKYVLVVLAALAIHQFITYGLIVRYGAKRDPVQFFKDLREVMLTAFSTSSSSATLPTSIRVTADTLKVNRDITNFVLTVGSTANQNGTALYEGITVLFLAQFFGVELSLFQQVQVVLLSVVAGIGT
ncbi:dicarboxylate/amino acid:cation symporter, partial [Candidatus Cyanaurora vandensis]